MKIRIKTSPDKRLVSFIVITVIALLLNNLVHNLPLSEEVVSLINNGLKFIVGAAFVAQTLVIFNRLDKHLGVFIIAPFIVIILNYAFFPDTMTYFINTIIIFFTFCLSTYVVIYSINDFDLLRTELTKASYFISFVIFLFLIAVFTGIVEFDNYDMALGYNSLLPTMILLWEYVRSRKIITLVHIFIMIISILLLGSRGSLISLVLFGMFFFIRFLIQNKKYWQVAFIVILALGIILSYRQMFAFLGNFLHSQGLYSRTVDLLQQEDIYLSKRDEVYNVLIYHILNAPLTVRGINAEWILFDSYAHNIVLELLYQFGFILGGLVLLYIFWRALKTLLFKELDSKRIFCIILMFSSLIPLFVSSTLWIHQIFWMWMAVYSKIAILDKYENLNEKQIIKNPMEQK